MPRHKRHGVRKDAEVLPFTLPADGMGPRAARMEHILYEEVDRLFRMEVNDRRLQDVVAVSLRMSPDLRTAKIYYAIRDPGEGQGAHAKERTVMEGLKSVAPFLRARIAEAISVKRAPDVTFHRDRLAESALRAEQILGAQPAKKA